MNDQTLPEEVRTALQEARRTCAKHLLTNTRKIDDPLFEARYQCLQALMEFSVHDLKDYQDIMKPALHADSSGLLGLMTWIVMLAHEKTNQDHLKLLFMTIPMKDEIRRKLVLTFLF